MKSKAQSRIRIKNRIRSKIYGTPERPRLSVFRSISHIYAQLIDDVNNKTLLSVSTKSKEVSEEINSVKNKTDKSKIVGKSLASKAKELNIENIVFDRNGYQYHGRVKALADAAREGGLKF